MSTLEHVQGIAVIRHEDAPLGLPIPLIASIRMLYTVPMPYGYATTELWTHAPTTYTARTIEACFFDGNNWREHNNFGMFLPALDSLVLNGSGLGTNFELLAEREEYFRACWLRSFMPIVSMQEQIAHHTRCWQLLVETAPCPQHLLEFPAPKTESIVGAEKGQVLAPVTARFTLRRRNRD